jgi:hypothetical protein
MRADTASGIRLGAAVIACVVVACSSFSSSSEPVGNDGGVDGALLEAGAQDSTTCTNVDTDPANCGRCGHSCEGGACAAGACQPFLLARFTDVPTSTVVLSQTHVFWSTIESISGGAGHVYSCAKSGCGGAYTRLPAGPNYVRGLGSDGDQKVYGGAFYAAGGIYELGPSTLTPRLDDSVAGYPLQMSVRPDALFYVSFYDPANDRTIRRWDYAGTVTKPCLFKTGEVTTAAAFTTTRAYLHANGTGKLYSCPLVGQNDQFLLYLSNLYLESLTATADRLFWAVGGAVTSSPDGDTSASLRSEVGPTEVGTNVTTVTVSGGDLFMTTAGGGLLSCAPNACKDTLRKLASESALETFHVLLSHTVAADAEAVYYIAVDTTSDGGRGSSRLMKVIR